MTVAATSFLKLMSLFGRAEGMPWLKAAEYPGAFDVETEEAVRKNIETMTFPQIVAALTKPVENVAAKRTAKRPDEIVFRGDLEKVNQFFSSNEWTDGLPIVPPTIDKVKEFLEYTDRPPHADVAVLPPGKLVATPWIIAVNGVMAGCRPKDMPLLIAAVEAMADPPYNLEQFGNTGGLNPFFLVNGPAIKQLDIKYDLGLVSLEPNVAIGRALGLIVRNVADLKPAGQNMGTFGYLMPFVLAEDEEMSPWPPFHTERGFDRNTSAVTAGATFSWGFQAFPSGTNAEGLLKILCREIVKHINLDVSGIQQGNQLATVLITPSVAKAIAAGGYSRRDAERYLFENSRVTMEEVNFETKYGDSMGWGTNIQEMVERGQGRKDWLNKKPSDSVTALMRPESVRIVVCGDRTRVKAMVFWGVYLHISTKEIKLPSTGLK